jgi:hypothetical protein
MIVLFPLFGLGIARTSYSAVYLWTLAALALACGVILAMTRLRTK